MHPQAIIVDASGEEEDFFLTAFRERANAIGTALIELPKDAEESLMWITRLDYASLSGAYNFFTIYFWPLSTITLSLLVLEDL